jgi:hypothetical protein
LSDNFERDVEAWLDELEGELNRALTEPGRRGGTETGEIVMPSVRAVRSPVGTPAESAEQSSGSLPDAKRVGAVGVRQSRAQTPARQNVPANRGVVPEPVPLGAASPSIDAAAMLAGHRDELVRTEKLLDVMRQLATEVQVLRRDVDQIKDVLMKLRDAVKARRKGAP